jgi:glycosyltransferase involved in cell wall biosynthesis
MARGQAAALFCPPEAELLRHAAGTPVDLTVCPLREDYDLLAARRLAETVRRFRPDVVHAHHPRAHAIALLAGLFVSIPRLVVSRRVSFKLKKWNPFSQLKYRSSRIRTYIAVSEDIRRVLIAGGVPPEKVVVIHSGVDTAKFTPRPPAEALRAALRIPAGAPVVGNLTHYSWWKGQAVFLEAARAAVTAGSPAHFLLVGKDTDGEDARRRVAGLGLGDRVTLAGFRTDMPEILSILSVSVVSSLAGEGFSGRVAGVHVHGRSRRGHRGRRQRRARPRRENRPVSCPRATPPRSPRRSAGSLSDRTAVPVHGRGRPARGA